MRVHQRITAAVTLFTTLSSSFAFAQAPAQPEALDKQRAVAMLEDLERAHSDIAKVGERRARMREIAREYVLSCSDAAHCQEGMVQALKEKGYPGETVANFGKIVAEGRQIAEDPSLKTEKAVGDAFRRVVVKYPVALPSGEGFQVDPRAFVMGGLVGIVAGAVVGVWALSNSHPIAGAITLGATGAWSVYYLHVLGGA